MSDLTSRLERELGAGGVRVDADLVEPYRHDECGILGPPPLAVALPRSAAEVAAVVRVVAEAGGAVVPRGAGTGMSGGCVPGERSVVLSLEKMARVVEIDEADLVAVVEPGVILGPFQAEVEERGLFYPPDPASLDSCSIGGNVAENAGGPRALRYGTTREYVLGLDVVMASGEQLRLGRRTPKGVTGYDFVGALVGSEGTLAITTRVTLRLLPKPRAAAALLAVFKDAPAAGGGVVALIRRGVRPRALELMDGGVVAHVNQKMPGRFPAGAGAVLLVELDGDPDALEPMILSAAEACEAAGAIDSQVALDEAGRRRFWEARRIVSPTLREAHKKKVSEDIVVPLGRIPAMLERVTVLGARHGFPTAAYGHAGDGNLHVNFLSDDELGPELDARFDRAVVDLFTETVAMGGTLSGEHGIGLTKRRYLSLEQPPELIAWGRRLKSFFDPGNLLNPGKIFP